MIKKMIYMLIPVSMVMSVSVADTLPTGPMVLSVNEMDQVTAGFSADVTAGAFGYSPIFAISKVNVATLTAISSGSNPGLAGGFAAAGGQAQAGAAGSGSTTSSSVTPTTDLAGANVRSNQINFNMNSSLVNISGAAIVSISLPTINPL